jgi:hypothetical protein
VNHTPAVIDCPQSRQRIAPAPTGQLAGVFFHEWAVGRAKNNPVNHHKQHTFNLPIDRATITAYAARAAQQEVQAVFLNWETLPIVQSRDVPLAHRYDDALALARTLRVIREQIDGVRIDLYGIRPWQLHRHLIDPADLWAIYFECGVRVDSVAVHAVNRTPEQTAMLIEARLRDFDRNAPEGRMSVLTSGEDQRQSEVVAKYGLDEIRWYPVNSTKASE